MKRWTAEETGKLREVFATRTNSELLDMFPGRSYVSIYKRAHKIGLKRDESIEPLNRKAVARKGHESNLWNGGSYKTKHGYIYIRKPEHPRANRNGYVPEHVYKWEEANHKILPDDWIVHHINGRKDDNSPENLVAMPRSAHTTMHCTGRTHTESTKSKISDRARKRFENPRNHPRYKEIDTRAMKAKVDSGQTLKSVCAELGINKTTYYKKVKEINHA